MSLTRFKTSVHTCNTEKNFGIDKLQDPKKCKSCCLTMNDYPTANGGCEGHTKRTFILEAED